ncbi:hypothetical protein SAY87_006733 [Trapa incisa]|uniref:Protein kinase domain-containing protein n=1 Tax=Trapa incisa TaxID=236973 RepID=A0AAN7JZ55_9MYRT|nr:hypothetical protein SAY87_006733 [Trapa incisa]
MSSRELSRGKQREKDINAAEKVVVAVRASKEIPKSALVWALTHVVQPGGCITLLVVFPSQSLGKRFWGFPRFAGDCASGHRKSHSGSTSEQKIDITDSCSQMVLQLHNVYDPKKINVKIKILSGSPCGAVSAEAKKIEANWVILDKHLKHEEKRCMEELQCNIVTMKHSQPKVVRLNLVGSSKRNPEAASLSLKPPHELKEKAPMSQKTDALESIQGPVVTPNSSPELGTPFTLTEVGTSSVSSSDLGTSPFFISEANLDVKKEEPFVIKETRELDECSSNSDTDSENMNLASSSMKFQPWKMAELFGPKEKVQAAATATKNIMFDHYSRNVRDTISLSRNVPPGPPPLCSICQHKAPVFGKPPRWFSYEELEMATGGFSKANFLAEGGFGSVHRGVLPDGQVVAVKQHKVASSQGDQEFCSEVEVLSCAQHRNVVMLIGFCIEDKRRLLVYEYICNGSLDSHLYGRHQEHLDWSARHKIAVGAARGLRYLHEECRVGCIVHRDMRPNNILITHDFESLVGDFGLARWQPDGDAGVETRVIGTFGYLAPEYAQSGQVTEKADVYSFGVVLVELVTGRKAVDLSRPKGQQCLTEWARPLLEDFMIDQLIDPQLGDRYVEHEVYCMLYAASLCIRRDPQTRPRISQVLRILEGDMLIDSNYMSTPASGVGNRSGRLWTDQQLNSGRSLPEEAMEAFDEKLYLGCNKTRYPRQ